jgi:hypothetical protein
MLFPKVEFRALHFLPIQRVGGRRFLVSTEHGSVHLASSINAVDLETAVAQQIDFFHVVVIADCMDC